MLQRDTVRSRELLSTVSSISNVSNTKYIKLARWLYAAARGRVKLVLQPNFEWIDKIRTVE